MTCCTILFPIEKRLYKWKKVTYNLDHVSDVEMMSLKCRVFPSVRAHAFTLGFCSFSNLAESFTYHHSPPIIKRMYFYLIGKVCPRLHSITIRIRERSSHIHAVQKCHH